MFNDFFILIGGIVLSIINFFENLSLNSIKPEKSKTNDLNSSIFSKLDLTTSPIKKKESKTDELRNTLVRYLVNKKAIVILIIILIPLTILTSLEISGMYLIILVMLYIFLLYYPKMKEQRGYGD